MKKIKGMKTRNLFSLNINGTIKAISTGTFNFLKDEGNSIKSNVVLCKLKFPKIKTSYRDKYT